jgi:vacuolar protein sorting-associated protein 13A/C
VLADKQAVQEVRSKQKQQYSDEDYQYLESLMYDQFFVKLHSAQLLMGESFEACMDALNADAHSGSELHVVERINLDFKVENSILSKSPILTRFKVSGQLPDLKVNFSDRKYRLFLHMIDVTVPRFGEPDQKPAQEAVSAPPDVRQRSFIQPRRLADEESISGPEESDDGSSDGNAANNDEFFEASQGEDGVSDTNLFPVNLSLNRRIASNSRASPEDVRVHVPRR